MGFSQVTEVATMADRSNAQQMDSMVDSVVVMALDIVVAQPSQTDMTSAEHSYFLFEKTKPNKSCKNVNLSQKRHLLWRLEMGIFL